MQAAQSNYGTVWIRWEMRGGKDRRNLPGQKDSHRAQATRFAGAPGSLRFTWVNGKLRKNIQH